jgi:RNase P subunit RPR2
MTYFENIIKAHSEKITDLYFKENYRKTKIAHKLIDELGLDLTHSQAATFERDVRQFLSDIEEARVNAPILNNVAAADNKYPNAIRTRAKVLLLDTETAPLIVASWGIRKQHLNIEQIVSDSHLICWAGKWLFDPDVFGDCLTSEEAIAKNDKRICQSLWDVMDEADIIIAHNGRSFDIPVINGRFFVNKFKSLPSPYEVIDTLDSSKKSMRLSSHKLDFINRISGLTVKLKTDFQLWLDCMKGIPEKLLEMYTYCKNDTSILEETYMEMRPWIKAHPNMAFYVESDSLICPTCGCTEVEERGTYRTGVNEYIAFSCPKCGAQGRSRNTSTTLQKKKSIIVSLGR